MLISSKVMRAFLIIAWGISLFWLVSEQRIDLKYILQEHVAVFEDDAYEFSSIGSDVDRVRIYRRDHGKGEVLYGFSAQEEFASVLSFNATTPMKIRFGSDFYATGTCKNKKLPLESRLHLIVNNESEYVLSHPGARHSEITLEISPDDQILVRAQAEQGACGAIKVVMNSVEKGGWQHFLLINGIWLLYIVLMLACGRLFLPLLSFGIFSVFQQAELIYSSVLPWQQLLLFSSVAIVVGILISLVVSVKKNRVLRRTIIGILSVGIVLFSCLLPMVVLGFDEMFQVQMTKYDWFAILQTDFTESIEFVRVFAPGSLIVKLVSFVVLLLLVVFFSGRKSIQYRFVHWFGIVFFIVVIFFVDSKSRLIGKSFAAINEYNEDLTWLKNKAKQREEDRGKIVVSKDGMDEIHVVIIGESANRNHFSLYGYPRFTNPELERRIADNDLVVYEQAYSCGVSTLGVLSYALTAATLKKGRPQTSSTVIEVLNRAGFETFWVHNGSTSLRNNLLGLISEQAQYTDHLSSIYGTEDGKLLEEVSKVLANDTGKNKVIFLKTQGSHVGYCKRLPEGDEWKFGDLDFDRWLIPNKYELTKVSAQSNCYDGSIKYTDYFIDEIINIVESKGKVASVVYVSDHGDEVVQGTAHMGNSPTYGVFAVPMILWFSEKYKQEYKEKYANIVRNAKSVFVNDVLFDSLLGLMAVDYEKLIAKNDISGSDFRNGKWIYRGKKTVYDSDNNIYNTPRNIDKISQLNPSYSVYIGPVEHPFHMAAFTGEKRYDLISLAAIYREGVFHLDSPLYEANQITMDTVLNYLPRNPEQEILFQVKVDDGEGNVMNEIIQQLFDLFNTHDINQESLLVSSNNQTLLKMLEDRNVKVSYQLDNKSNVIEKKEYEAITVELDQLLNIKDDLDGIIVDVKISSCDINSCSLKVFEQIDALADEIHVRSVILPLYDL